MKRVGKLHTFLFRATGGLIGRRADGLDMLLLTTTGHRSGIARTTPLPYFRDGARLVLIASFGGNDRDPAWLGNLRAKAAVRIQLGRRAIEATAKVADEPERARLWWEITADHPRFLVYQAKTDRQIPLAIIEPSVPV